MCLEMAREGDYFFSETKALKLQLFSILMAGSLAGGHRLWELVAGNWSTYPTRDSDWRAELPETQVQVSQY